MQLKAADDKQPDIAALQKLLERPGLDARTHQRIRDELWAIREGVKAERDGAYEIEFHLGKSRHFATIHDLRLDIDGSVAQIDHLVISRVLEVFVCESKRFGSGVEVNELGEWTTFRSRKPVGVPSPIEQNRRHIVVLERAIELGRIRLPGRIGVLPIKPSFHSRVLVSKEGSIHRPRERVPGMDDVMKVDQFRTNLRERDISAASMLKLVTIDQLVEFGRQLVGLHRPARVDWPARFGLASSPAPPTEAPRRSSGHRCAECQLPVAFAVVKFCWNNKARFGDRVLCIECQARYPKVATAR
jgi:hypothetical protein